MTQRPPVNPAERFATLVSVLLILIVVFVLFVAKEIFVPLALALLFSFVLAPLVTRFERWRLGRIPSVLLTVLLAFCVLGGIGYIVGNQMVDLTSNLPSYKTNISHRIQTVTRRDKNSALSKAQDTIKELGDQISNTTPESNGTRPDSALSKGKDDIAKVQVVEPATSMSTLMESVVGPVLSPIGTATVVVVFVLFMLIKREDLRDRIIHLIGRGQLSTTTQALDEAAGKVSGYLLMQLIINTIFGVLTSTGLFFIGVPNAFLWGLLAIVLRFIPYVGAWISLGFPLLLSLAVTDTWSMPIETLALYAVIELVTSNILEPWLYGAHTGLSPVAIMVATIFWTWMWGGVGLLLATPLTVCVAVLGKYIPSLSFLDALLGDEPTLSNNDRYYQRLLALDRREAGLVAENYLKDHTLPELYSGLIVPALAAAEREQQQGSLDERHQRFVYDTTREIVEEMATRAPALAAAAQAKEGKLETGDTVTTAAQGADGAVAAVARVVFSKYPVFCLPAANEGDEIVAVMLAQLLEHEGYKSESVSYKTLANEMVAQVSDSGCVVVCISATPPHDTLHTRYLCKLLRSKLPQLRIIVGLWDSSETDPEKLVRRRERLAADHVVTNLTDALEQIRPLAGLEA